MTPTVNTHSQHRPTAQEPSPSCEAAKPNIQQLNDIPSCSRQVLERVQSKIAPVWPLADYVAVNPYSGFITDKFLAARMMLQSVSDGEVFMPMDYYRRRYADGHLERSDVNAAVDEMVADGMVGSENIDVNQIMALLRGPVSRIPSAEVEFNDRANSQRSFHTMAEYVDRYTGSTWNQTILEEISKHCSAHYDTGQAAWPSPWRDLPLYQAWRCAAQHDRTWEVLGITGLRATVAHLPDDPHVALSMMLNDLGVPPDLWEDYLLGEALTMPGWSAWTKYQQQQAELRRAECTDFSGLLAMRLTYEVSIARRSNFRVDWNSIGSHHRSPDRYLPRLNDERLMRYALLKATEIRFRRTVLHGLVADGDSGSILAQSDRPLAQLVFCIDVRSERMRRQLEAVSDQIETFGFAGFFGIPMEYVPLGESSGRPQVPAILAPRFKVYEDLVNSDKDATESTLESQRTGRLLSDAWTDFKKSAVMAYTFVESLGLFYVFALIARLVRGCGCWPIGSAKGITSEQRRFRPSLRGLSQQGMMTSQQADLAESILRGIGIVERFAPIVVLCGHCSQTANNPLQAGFDCGACGGHSGEPNARFAATLLNQKSIRQALASRGIVIPDDTRFVAALHNTTTDTLMFPDIYELVDSHGTELEQLKVFVETACEQARQERLGTLRAPSASDLFRRSRDWSEVRPEWGLAGNACFIAAPRELTMSTSLQGRAFLHSYDYRHDPDFTVLDQILTGPLVVAHWINMQYYASAVDPTRFGSGTKTIHNVVGRFGILSGNGGDLMTGLPWQSVHDGQTYQHEPLRLLTVIAAPPDAIVRAVTKHAMVHDLAVNGWLHLVACWNGTFFRYNECRSWDELSSSRPSAHSATGQP